MPSNLDRSYLGDNGDQKSKSSWKNGTDAAAEANFQASRFFSFDGELYGCVRD